MKRPIITQFIAFKGSDMPRQIDHLPFPYLPEDDVVSDRLLALDGALDWAAAAKMASPWDLTSMARRCPPTSPKPAICPA